MSVIITSRLDKDLKIAKVFLRNNNPRTRRIDETDWLRKQTLEGLRSQISRDAQTSLFPSIPNSRQFLPFLSTLFFLMGALPLDIISIFSLHLQICCSKRKAFLTRHHSHSNGSILDFPLQLASRQVERANPLVDMAGCPASDAVSF
jgi:hypothetical protein